MCLTENKIKVVWVKQKPINFKSATVEKPATGITICFLVNLHCCYSKTDPKQTKPNYAMGLRPDGEYDSDYDESKDPEYKPTYIEATVQSVEDFFGENFAIVTEAYPKKEANNFFDCIDVEKDAQKRENLVAALEKIGFWQKERNGPKPNNRKKRRYVSSPYEKQIAV